MSVTKAAWADDRFWAKVDKSGGPDACWPWTGRIRKRDGYGTVSREGKARYTHRVALTGLLGDIDSSVCSLHRCDNPPCCNPNHLFDGDRDDNNRDAAEKGRTARLTGRRNGMFNNREAAAKGDNNAMSKLNKESAIEIRRLSAEGLSQRVLAAQFGVSRGTVRAILDNRTWA